MKKIVISFMLAAVLITGCAKDNRPSDLPPLYPCAITITQEGEPLNGATVSLFAVEGTSSKYQPSGITDANGKATLMTYGFEGAPAGKYKVCVRKTIIEDGGKTLDGYGEEIDAPGIEYRAVEQEYSDVATTPHEIEISNKRTPPHTFDVGKAVKEPK